MGHLTSHLASSRCHGISDSPVSSACAVSRSPMPHCPTGDQGRWREKFGKPINETFGFLLIGCNVVRGGCGCEGVSETPAVCGGYKGAWWGWGTESAYGTPTMPCFFRQLNGSGPPLSDLWKQTMVEFRTRATNETRISVHISTVTKPDFTVSTTHYTYNNRVYQVLIKPLGKM